MKLYKHQEDFLNKNPDKALVCFSAGTGKTLTALLGMKKRDGNKIVVCPKSLKQRGIEDLESEDITADVFTKEEFKKEDLTKYDVMVFDEAQGANSPVFVKGTSQITEKIYKGIQSKPDAHMLSLTATPISSKPGNLHTLLTFTGKYIDGKKFREYFYSLESPPYMKGRYMYVEKDFWRKEIRKLQLKYAYNATMEDIVDFIPKQYKEVVKIPLPKKVKDEIAEVDNDLTLESDIARGYAKHKLEQHSGKIAKIKEIAGQHSKVVVFAKYKDQIKELESKLTDRKVYVMTGDTKDQGAVIKQAQEDSECYFIIQADISEGYELPDFTCVIYASQSGRKISDIQSQARVQRINNLKSNGYYWLVSGDKDRAVQKAIDKGNDFII